MSAASDGRPQGVAPTKNPNLNQCRDSEAKANMKKALVWTLAGALAGYLVFYLLPDYFRQEPNPRAPARLSEIAAELNRSVPVMIDKETELTLVEGHEGMLIYKYRLVPYSVGQLDHEKFAAGAKQRVTQGAEQLSVIFHLRCPATRRGNRSISWTGPAPGTR